MKISGLQKLTLLDFPGKMACTVFTYGCNFRCGFCLIGGQTDVDPGLDADAFIQVEMLVFFIVSGDAQHCHAGAAA